MTRKGFQAIIAATDAARAELGRLERALQDGIDAIERRAAAAGRFMTAEEKAERRRLRAQQGEIRDGFRRLAHVTLVRLDDTSEIRRVRQEIEQVNADIGDELSELKAIQAYGVLAVRAADALAALAKKVAGAVA